MPIDFNFPKERRVYALMRWAHTLYTTVIIYIYIFKFIYIMQTGAKSAFAFFA